MKRFVSILLTALALLVVRVAPLYAQEAPIEEAITAYDRVEFIPTRFHAQAYYGAVMCTGTPGDFSTVRWFIATHMVSIDNNREYIGLWSKPGDIREITIIRDRIFDLTVITHEILHDLYDGEFPVEVANRCIPHWQLLRPILSIPETINHES